MKIPFDNSYIKLPSEFYTKIQPSAVQNPSLIIFNQDLATELGITDVDVSKSKMAQIFSGNKILAGAEPLAMVYAGHQFGGFSPQLGDGRANLLGEVVVGSDSQKTRYDIQLKGSGRTPYSRGGDGRSALGPVLREYLVSEAMHQMGVPTTRALAAVSTGEEVARDSLVPGGILTRVAKGFVRVGTFEYYSAQQNYSAIKQLADYEIARHYPNAQNTENPYASFLAEVVEAQAKLIAQWMHLGFIHGVMNTDNMSIAGETIDYGPCAFMDEFQHDRIYSSIDHQKRYAYSNQANIGQWNLIRLAETLLPLFIKDSNIETPPSEKQAQEAVEIAQNILNNYKEKYQYYWLKGMRHKLGLFDSQQDNDATLVKDLFNCMEENKADFTLTFNYLSVISDKETANDNDFRSLFNKTEELEGWMKTWRHRLTKEPLSEAQRQTKMQSINPIYIPRNHLIEEAIRAAEDHNNFTPFYELHEVLQNPFARQKGKDRYQLAPKPEEVVHKTFCGT